MLSLVNNLNCLEKFSMESPKTKTSVITLANYKATAIIGTNRNLGKFM